MDRVTEKKFEEFVALLVQQKEFYEALLQTEQGKLKAMREGNLDLLESWTAREAFLVERIKFLDNFIHQCLQQFGGSAENKIRIKDLAESLPEPIRSRVLTLSETIRKLAEEVKSVNQIVGEVSNYMLDMFYEIRRNLADMYVDPGIYNSDGRRFEPISSSVLDAVG